MRNGSAYLVLSTHSPISGSQHRLCSGFRVRADEYQQLHGPNTISVETVSGRPVCPGRKGETEWSDRGAIPETGRGDAGHSQGRQ